jgi:hypothetical protein
VTVDLDAPDIAELESLWRELERRHAIRNADPKLRAAVIRRTNAALADGRLDESGAAEIQAEIDKALPAVVLEAHFGELVSDCPALGAYARRSSPEAPTADERLREDPERRLSNVVQEMRCFGDELQRIIEAALDLADRLGIDELQADDIVAAALRGELAKEQSIDAAA